MLGMLAQLAAAAEAPKVEKDHRFDEKKIYKPLIAKKYDLRENKISLKGDADMNDVFVPKKCEKEEIETVLFIQSAVPKIK